MKVLSIGSDRKLFDEKSGVRQRIIEYGNLVDELHIVILNQNSKCKNQNDNLKIKNENFRNIYLYPTNSCNKWFYVLDAYKIAKKIIGKPRAEKEEWLLTSQDPFEGGMVGWLIARKYKIPLQLQIHTDFLSPYFWKESLLNKIRVLIAKFLIPRASCVRAVSGRIKKSLELRTKNQDLKVVVLPIFIDVKSIQGTPITVNVHKQYPQFDFIILMASRLTREKNIGLAIEALSGVIKRYPETGLMIIGDGPERKNLGSRIRNLELQKNIVFEPFVPFEKLISYYKTADLFLLTSNYEGYGRGVVEAMAAGCPVVMTDVGLSGEVLVNEKNGLAAPVNDREKLSEAILRLIESQELRNYFALGAQKIIDSWPSKDEYLKNYQAGWQNCFK